MVTKQVTILDYGMANLLNVARAFKHLGADVSIAETPEQVQSASRLVVPGVGAFHHAMSEIVGRGFDHTIRRFAESGKPLFGICVGMQMLFDSSEEFGDHAGLGILHGHVVAIPRTTLQGHELRVPNIGWSRLILPESGRSWSGTLFEPFSAQGPAVYFVHSFVAKPAHEEDRLADCEYGGYRLCAAVQRDNIFATQFHPERSGEAGLSILRKFLD